MKTTLILALVIALASCGPSTETKIEEARKEYAHAKKMSKEYYAAGDSEKFIYWMKKELEAGAKLEDMRQAGD